MKENKNTLMSVIANTALTAVASARIEECATLTTNETALKAVSAYAQLDVFDTKYNIKKCEILSIVAHELKEEKSLTFKKMCEIFNIDNSNASKMVTIWDNYYSNDRELKGGYHFTDYSVSQLAPFVSKQVTSVEKLFTEYEVSPKTAVSRMREFAKWINKNGIDHWNEIIDIINGVVKNGDITTKTETEKETEKETETETKTKTKTETETEKKPIVLKPNDIVTIGDLNYRIVIQANNEPKLVIAK